jgi:hypothetical protein
MIDLEKVFNFINNNDLTRLRFLTIQTGKNEIATIDLDVVHEIEIHDTQIWIGQNVFIKYPETNYNLSIEEFYLELIKTWIKYKEYPLK